MLLTKDVLLAINKGTVLGTVLNGSIQIIVQ